MTTSHLVSKENELTHLVENKNSDNKYPFEYFDAQVRFALKWSVLSGVPLTEVLQKKTALYRRVTGRKYPYGDEIWNKLTVGLSDESLSPEIIATGMYDTYLDQPQQNNENTENHFGMFAFDYYPANDQTGEKNRIKVHFLPQKNKGDKSSLDIQFLDERRADIHRMFTYIHEKHPQAEEVIGGSWLYALNSYRDSFPPQFTVNMKRLVPPEFAYIPNTVPTMSFTGDSVWGQFIDRNGGVRQYVYDVFIKNVLKSKTLEDLINSFPNFTYQPKVPISVFYEWIKK